LLLSSSAELSAKAILPWTMTQPRSAISIARGFTAALGGLSDSFAPATRRQPGDALEGANEGNFGFVSHAGGDAGDGFAAGAQALPERSGQRRSAAAPTIWPARPVLTPTGYLMPR
jgi:hypothetical protein